MKIDIVPYLEKALEEIVGEPVDLSSVHLAVELDPVFDTARNAVIVEPRLSAGADADQRFRDALINAGLDDLRVFELGRAFDAAIKEAFRVQTS